MEARAPSVDRAERKYARAFGVLAARGLMVYRGAETERRVHVRVTPIIGILVVGLFGATVAPALAQGQGPFGGFKHDRTAPIEITSDALEVRQAENLAIFSGDVVAGQGTLRLTADQVEVTYDQQGGDDSETGAIRNMQATGNVFISNGAETAQGERAQYDVQSGLITMTGSVVLTQGENAISGERLTINLNEGQGRMEGRVKSIFSPQRDGQGTN